MKCLLVVLSLCMVSVLSQQPVRQRAVNGPPPQQNYPQENYQPLDQQGQKDYQKPRYETTTYIPIIRFDKEQGTDGSYKTAWETGNNIVAEETGFLKSIPPQGDNKEEGHAQVQHGSYSYTAPDGTLINVEYTADENGFRPSGDHLPTPPPVSPEVQKGLDLIYAGIKAQQEAAARDPESVKDFVNNAGFYRGN